MATTPGTPESAREDGTEPWEADDWNERPTVERLQVIHDTLDDRGMCAYFRRGEPGQDPKGTCSFGCRDEPSCMTDRWGPYPSELLREVIHDLTDFGSYDAAPGGD